MSDRLSIKEVADFLHNTLYRIQHFTEQIKPFRKDPRLIYTMTLYASVIEYAHGCLSLLRSGDLVSLPLLVRSMLEAHVDLINVTADADYVHVLQAAFFRDQMALLSAARRDPGNPFLETFAKLPDLDDRISELKEQYEDEMDQAQKFGKNVLSISERFRLAGLDQLYPSVYKMLCQDTHNNTSSLFTRHLEERSHGFDVTFFRKKSVAELAPALDAMFAVLLTSVKSVREFFRVNSEQQKFGEFDTTVREFKEKLARQRN